MCIKFEIRKICIAGNQCDNSDLDIHKAEEKKLPVFIKMCSDERRDDFQQLKPKGSHASFVTTVIAVTILLMLSILFSTVLVFVLRFVFYVTRYMHDARRRDFALSASFVSELECFDGSEVTGKGNDSIVQKQNCVVEEIKEVELGSRRVWENYL